ncbi:Phenylacetic acid catabolic protein [Sulfobacillus thermosulfidooxidans]|uniref:Phenylacetic acid catabolic protein n=1 Tax=Sulfobacillus thermosulfidooxidans TaxID=28034 RepID=UPI00030E625E|nr:Phenylacetic acid catabolic protein [Sulfobacillus thermosulfidooxidans]
MSQSISAPKRVIEWGDYQGIRKFEHPDELAPDMRQLLLKMLITQADTEFASVQQHRPWLDKAPTVNDRLTISRILADEMRHGWQICQLLQTFEPEGQEAIHWLLKAKLGEHRLDSFNMDYETWEDVLAFTCLVDRVGIYQLRAFEGCGYGPLARAIPLMLVEEQLHINFGYNGIKRLARNPNTRDSAQQAINKWFPRALDMFGHSESKASESAVRFGIKKWQNEEARMQYINEVRMLFESVELELPDPSKDRRIL